MAKDEITLVGGGLVGSLLALGLGQKGFQVTVHERRADLRSATRAEGRSINLAISARGIQALSNLGRAQEVLDASIPMRGRQVHFADGSEQFQAYSDRPEEAIRSISRAGLNRLLLSWAEASGQVKFHFGSRVQGVDFAAQSLAVEGSHGTIQNEKYQVLIGTDGSASVLREALVQKQGTQASESVLSHGYKELVLPAGPGGAYQLEKNALHIWPRKSFMLIALPNEDGSFTCTLFLPLTGTDSFDTLSGVAPARKFFDAHFPDALAKMPSFDEEYQANPVGKMVTVRTERWHDGGRVMLLGDAAHAIVPFFGQGMNCGFEDVDLLLRELVPDRSWEDVFSRVEQGRKPNALAIAQMAIENFVEMRDKVSDPRFLAEKKAEKVLSREFPKHFVPRYQLVSFTRVPYRDALEIGEVQREILQELGAENIDSLGIDLQHASSLVEQRLARRMDALDLESLRGFSKC